MTFNNDMTMSRAPQVRFFVETKVPDSMGKWLKASTNHETRDLADQSLRRLSDQPNSLDVQRRVGAEVVLRYGVVDPDNFDPDNFKHKIYATWPGKDGLINFVMERRIEILLHSEEVGDIILRLTPDQLRDLLQTIRATHDFEVSK